MYAIRSYYEGYINIYITSGSFYGPDPYELDTYYTVYQSEETYGIYGVYDASDTSTQFRYLSNQWYDGSGGMAWDSTDENVHYSAYRDGGLQGDIDNFRVRKYLETTPSSTKTAQSSTLVQYDISSDSIEDYQLELDVSDLSLSSVDDSVHFYVAGGGYGFETINETAVSLSTNAEYALSEILKENEIILNLEGDEVSADRPGYGLLSISALNDVELSVITSYSIHYTKLYD